MAFLLSAVLKINAKMAELNIVLDASALLALLLRENGAARVEAAFEHNVFLSTVNFAEVIGFAERNGLLAEDVRHAVLALPLQIVVFDENTALETGKLTNIGQSIGLSLGDRACIATAKLLGAEAWTADKAWTRLHAGITIKLVR